MDYHAAKAFILDKLGRELSPKLSYHGQHHTLDVWQITSELCVLENISPYESILLKTAALYHDSGFIIHNKDHEALSCGIARNHLPGYGYSPSEIDRICSMIMATKIPQNPGNSLEAILCDADLDYLGRADFYTIGATLFHELETFGVLQGEYAWNQLQVTFLEKHKFLTPTNIRRRNAQKNIYLAELKQRLSACETI